LKQEKQTARGWPPDAEVPEIADLEPGFDISAFAPDPPGGARPSPPSVLPANAPATPRPSSDHHQAAVSGSSRPQATLFDVVQRVRAIDWSSDRLQRRVLIGVAATTSLGLMAVLVVLARPTTVSPPTIGTIQIESAPAAARVSIDGRASGVTPLKVALAAGRHRVAVDANGRRRGFSVDVTAGAVITHHVLLDADAPPDVGALKITSRPAGARVHIDGKPRGRTPILVPTLSAGDHQLAVSGTTGTVEQTVTVRGGQTATVLVPLAVSRSVPLAVSQSVPVAPSGLLRISAPVELHVIEGGRFVGTSHGPSLRLPTGRHEIELVNEAVGFRDQRVVSIAAGRTITVAVLVPGGSMSLNATPWAEVWLDGRLLGETPLGEVPAAAGPHDVLFRHPELGDRRVRAVVRAGELARVTADLRR
jgi:hypothetical protein